jgi:hypothetical protein
VAEGGVRGGRSLSTPPFLPLQRGGKIITASTIRVSMSISGMAKGRRPVIAYPGYSELRIKFFDAF